MVFDEEKAREVIRRHGLGAKTYSVWKFRGAIPDRYAGDGCKVKSKTVIDIPVNDKAHEVMTRRVMAILKLGAIQTLTFSQLVDANLHGVCAGNRRLSQDELASLKKEIRRLRADILNMLGRSSLPGALSLLNDKRIKPYSLMAGMPKSELSYLLKTEYINELQFERIKNNFLDLALHLNI
jgi:hypothetical protein